MDCALYPLRLPRYFFWWGDLYWPPRREGIFYLTIDDGPEPEALPILLALLERYGAQATFFWLGEKAEAYRRAFDPRSLYGGGHRVELHGYAHVSPWRLSRKAWAADVERGFRVLAEWLPEVPRYYRPPYGRYRPMRKQWPLRPVLWDLMPPDYRLQRGWARPAVQKLRPGDVVVLHERKAPDWAEWEAFLWGTAQKGLQARALP